MTCCSAVRTSLKSPLRQRADAGPSPVAELIIVQPWMIVEEGVVVQGYGGGGECVGLWRMGQEWWSAVEDLMVVEK